MVSAFDLTTIVKALTEANTFIAAILLEEQGLTQEGELVWNPVDPGKPGHDEQVQLMQRFKPIQGELDNFGELQAWARWKAEEINKILADHGFSIRLEPWADDRTTFGVVAIYDLTIEWRVKGSVVDKRGLPYLVNHDRPAFRLDKGEAGVEFYDVGMSTPLIRIPGKNPGDYVCLIGSWAPIDGFELLSTVEAYRQRRATAPRLHDWSGVVLPNVVSDEEVNVSWLIGLWTVDDADTNWRIVQAKMQARFALGPKGARAKVGAAVSATREAMMIPRPDHIVDYDFAMWMERDGVISAPLFSAFVPKEEFARETVDINTAL